MNTLGKQIRVTSYGESHGEFIGAILDGFPSNFKLDTEYIQLQLDRRKPGQSAISTPREESDEVEISSGVFEGKTTGAPIHFTIPNKNQDKRDYSHLKDVYRPSHADFTYEKKYGVRDFYGGGRSSARITAGWVAAGALVQDYIHQKFGINISAYVKQIGNITLQEKAKLYSRLEVDHTIVRCPNHKLAEQMISEIENAKQENDSLGGTVECIISGLDAGIGDPVFSKLNAQLAHAMFSINAVKGFEVGGGFSMTTRKGSEVNDLFSNNNGVIKTKSNYSGGIQGGISNGMPIVFRVGFKPTSTIGKEQKSIDKEGNSIQLKAIGRHDPCVVPRAVPIVETLSALVLGDFLIK